MANYKLVAGLGNPGEQYALTRHNIGFMALDRFCERVLGGATASWRKRSNALIARVPAAGSEVLLIKPLTYMNLSGQAVTGCMSFFKVLPEEIIVVHDDIDLPFGALRIKKGCGDAGHKGVRSISATLGEGDYVRIRCGVGRPQECLQDETVPGFVLDRFGAEEQSGLSDFLDRSAAAIEALLGEGLAPAQNKFNREV